MDKGIHWPSAHLLAIAGLQRFDDQSPLQLLAYSHVSPSSPAP